MVQCNSHRLVVLCIPAQRAGQVTNVHIPCHCRQCRQLLCDGSGTTADDCDMPFNNALMPCYEYRGLPPEQQVSVFPQPEWEAAGNISYWYGFADDMAVKRQSVSAGMFDGRWVHLPMTLAGVWWLQGRCRELGSCVRVLLRVVLSRRRMCTKGCCRAAV
jgi:hypothetical protein